jgi:hexosaminidase
LDFSKQNTFDTVNKIITEVQDLFPAQYIHLGGDEVGEKCYLENNSFKEWGKTNKLESMHDFELYYRNTLL